MSGWPPAVAGVAEGVAATCRALDGFTPCCAAALCGAVEGDSGGNEGSGGGGCGGGCCGVFGAAATGAALPPGAEGADDATGFTSLVATFL
jgi:hypothetical protein